ncbi:MAG: hypothetical protein DMG38_22670 [Acidobacteria bacterium]|nr:MAG: hypothetical protein DMG38_22670 [Acidobacteriota bacterium]
MLSGVNVLEISDIQDQEDETEAPAVPNVTMLHSVENSGIEFLRTTQATVVLHFLLEGLTLHFGEWHDDSPKTATR